MGSRNSTTRPIIDVQNLVADALKLEVKLLNAGFDTVRVYLNQAARLSDLVSETLQAVQDDKATFAGTTKKLTEFGRGSVRTFAELSQRLGGSYYDELDRLAGGARKTDAAQTTLPVRPSRKTVRPAAKRAPTERSEAAKSA